MKPVLRGEDREAGLPARTTARKSSRKALLDWASGKRYFPRHMCLGLIEANRSPSKSSGRADFPRHMCLGLIEARCPDRRPQAKCCIFRGTCASASLKHPYQYRTKYKHKHFPRHMCLGLIEAFLRLRSSLLRRIIFRGTCASASLKQPSRNTAELLNEIFRGTCASASLKLDT